MLVRLSHIIICHTKHVGTRSAEVDLAQLKEYLPKHAEYACCHWADRFRESGLSRPHDTLLEFLKNPLHTLAGSHEFDGQNG